MAKMSRSKPLLLPYTLRAEMIGEALSDRERLEAIKDIARQAIDMGFQWGLFDGGHEWPINDKLLRTWTLWFVLQVISEDHAHLGIQFSSAEYLRGDSESYNESMSFDPRTTTGKTQLGLRLLSMAETVKKATT